MRGLNIRKLAAIAVGGALVGSALAPMAAAISLQKSDVVNTATGAPIVNVVVGTNGAAVSDFVWAGNIAAKVAQLATKESSVTGGTGTANPTDLSVDLTVGGSASYTTESAHTFDGTDYPLKSGLNLTEFVKEVGQGQLAFLTNTTKNFRYNSSTYSIVVKETIGLEADAKFDGANTSVKDLVVYLSGGDLNYMLSLGTGIPAVAGTGADGSTAFTDGDNDNIVIPFLGSDYTVQSVDITGTTKMVKLMKESAKTNYNEGQTITGITGKETYAGQIMSVKVAAVTQAGSAATAYNARFELYDGNGNLVDSQTVSEGAYLNESFVDSGGNYALDTVIYVSTIRVEPTTSKGVVTAVVGKNVIQIADNKLFPYDSTETNPSNYLWKATLDFNTTTNIGNALAVATLNKITIWNNVKVWDSSAPLWSTDDSLTLAGKDAAAAGKNVASFLAGMPDTSLGYDFVKVKFDGFKWDQSTTQIKVGNNQIVYTDGDSIKRTVPFTIQLTTVPGSTATEQTFTVDNQTFYARCQKRDNAADFNISDGNYLNGSVMDINSGFSDFNLMSDKGWTDLNGPNFTAGTSTVDLNGVQYTIMSAFADPSNGTNGAGVVRLRADGNCEFSTQSFTATPDYLNLGGAANYTRINDAYIAKTVFYDDDNTTRLPLKVPIGVKNSSLKDTYLYRMVIGKANSKVWLLLDNSTAFSNVFSNADVTFDGTDIQELGYINATQMPFYLPDTTEFANADGSDNSFYTAVFSIDANGGLPDANVAIDTFTGNLVSYPNNNLSVWTSDVNAFRSAPAWTLNVSTADTALKGAYLDNYGSKFEITDEKKTVTATIPQAAVYLSLSVLGKAAVQTTSGGESATGVKVNEKTKIGSADVTVDKVNYVAGTCTVSDATYNEVVKVGELVYADTPEPAGNHIIVGGYLVNRLAEGVTLEDGSALNEVLTASGDKVVQLLPSGDIVVAGFTASDTRSAAQELIDALDALVA